jgi:hypothetical protein
MWLLHEISHPSQFKLDREFMVQIRGRAEQSWAMSRMNGCVGIIKPVMRK